MGWVKFRQRAKPLEVRTCLLDKLKINKILNKFDAVKIINIDPKDTANRNFPGI